MNLVEIAVDKIKLHPDRFYREPGDVSSLAKSMDGPNGQLQPILVDSEHFLVFGARRLEAARLNGWLTITARIADLDNQLLAIRDENDERASFTLSERVSLGAAIEAREKELARMRQGRPGMDRADDSPDQKGEAKEKAAEAAGMSRPTYEKAKAVVESGNEDLISRMDETGKVAPVYAEVVGAKKTQSNGDDHVAAVERALLAVRKALDARANSLGHARYPKFRMCNIAFDALDDAWRAWRGDDVRGDME